MATTKVAVTVDAGLSREVDKWVAARNYPNRRRAVQAGLLRLREERARH